MSEYEERMGNIEEKLAERQSEIYRMMAKNAMLLRELADMRRPQYSDGNMQCYWCKKAGHLKRQCELYYTWKYKGRSVNRPTDSSKQRTAKETRCLRRKVENSRGGSV